MNNKKKVKVFKIMLMILVLVLCVAMIIYLFPVMKNLSTTEGQIEFKEKVQNLGVLGMILLFGLQVAQIYLIIIPGEPIEILAGMCYGGLWGTVFMMVSVFIISTTIFFIVRKLGRKFVCDFCDENKIKKIENSKLFQNPKKIEIIMFILFLIPGTPKDLLTYIGGILPIKPINFIIISTLARFPSIISSTLAGESLAVGDWKKGIILYGIVLAIVVIIMLIIHKFDKDKTTTEALKTIK